MLKKIIFNAKKFVDKNIYGVKTIIYNDDWVLMHDGTIQSTITNILYFDTKYITSKKSNEVISFCADGRILIYRDYIILLSTNLEIINMKNNKIICKIHSNFDINCSKIYVSETHIFMDLNCFDNNNNSGLYQFDIGKELVAFVVDDSAILEVLDECIIQYDLKEIDIDCYNKKILCEVNDSYKDFKDFKDLKKQITENYKKNI
jgi:hypothetical protein